MKFISALSLLFCIQFCFAGNSTLQEVRLENVEIDSLHQVIVDWKVGDEKKVTRTDTTMYWKEDSLFLKTHTTSSYVIKVYDLENGYYTVGFRQDSLYDSFKVGEGDFKGNTLQERVQELLAYLQQHLSQYEFKMYVNQSTGQAEKILNEESFMKLIEEVVSTVLDKLLLGIETKMTKEQLLERVKQVMNTKRPEIIGTTINQFNLIFQLYSMPFKPNAEVSYPQEIYNANLMTEVGSATFNCTNVISSSYTEEAIEVGYEIIYTKEEVLKAYKLIPKLSHLKIEDLDIEEKSSGAFDTNSSWLKHHYHVINTRIGDVKVFQSQYQVFQ